jgi:hypothetical protein
LPEKRDEYPVATLHRFLEEASKEFRQFRFQAKVNLVGSIILLLFLSRILIFAFGNGPPPFTKTAIAGPAIPFDLFYVAVPDFVLLFAALAAVLWSFSVWIKQRKFVSRWGNRFEKLDQLEKKLLPDESS